MKNLICFLLLATAFGSSGSGQTATPSPTPPAIGEEDVVKITTSLIQIDVTVTDRRGGRIVQDLKPEEIEIYENGRKQKITNFSFISNLREPALSNGRSRSTPAPLPPSPVKPEHVRRTIALVVDDLTLSFESTHQVRRALAKFVNEQMQPGDLVAIIRTGAGIGALQQFTADRRMLYAAIEKIKWNPMGAGKVGAFAPLEARPDLGVPEIEPEGGRTLEELDRDMNEFRNSVFATGTLGAVNYVIRGMQELPGRKSIMLLSDGFKLFTEDRSGFRESTRVLESLRRLVDQANRASVVIYTMDPRGLQTTGLTAADNTTGRTPQEIQDTISGRRDELRETQDGLVYLARQTGGFAFINNNDLSGGVRRVLDDQSYYLIGYEPDGDTFDPKTRRFNRLDVRVTRPGTLVRYRSGFFGISDEKLRPAPETGNQRLLNALSSPFSINDIAVRLNALFGHNPDQGSFIRSLLHVNAQDLTFTDAPDGSKVLIFDVLAVAFGDNGMPVDQIAKTYTVTLNKEQHENFLRRGFVYDFAFPIKKPGAYQLRVALRDHKNQKIGSANQFVETPNLKKNRLTLSGAGLENTSFEEWERRNSAATVPGRAGTDPLTDTSLRQFKKGTVLNYGFAIFNAKLNAAREPQLTARTRLFKDGKPVFEGKIQPIIFAGQKDPRAVNYMGTLGLGTQMTPGEYLLEVAVTDNLVKGKYATASQFIQFEIVE